MYLHLPNQLNVLFENETYDLLLCDSSFFPHPRKMTYCLRKLNLDYYLMYRFYHHKNRTLLNKLYERFPENFQISTCIK